jgi:hypothetical protein
MGKDRVSGTVKIGRAISRRQVITRLLRSRRLSAGSPELYELLEQVEPERRTEKRGGGGEQPTD